MPELLSQQDIDNLLSGLSAGAAPPQSATQAPRTSDREIIPFDFRLPHRLSKNQLRVLQSIHESFAESFASFLVGKMQTSVTINTTSVDQLFYSEFVLSIASPSCLYVFRVNDSHALALMELTPQFVLTMVGRLLGGNEEDGKETRNITRLEQSIIKGIVARAMADLQKAWSSIAPLTFTLDRYESEGEFAQIVPPSEIVLVISFEVLIGQTKHLMNLCFPTFALEDVLARLNAQNAGFSGGKRNTKWTETIAGHLEWTSVSVKGLLGETTITVRELLELRCGDILRTKLPVGGQVHLLVGDRLRIAGKLGVSNGKLAVRVTDTLSEAT